MTKSRGTWVPRGSALELEAIEEEEADADGSVCHDSRVLHPASASTPPMRCSQPSANHPRTPDVALPSADGGFDNRSAGSTQSRGCLANEVEAPVNWLINSSSSPQKCDQSGDEAMVYKINFSHTVHHHLPLLIPSSRSPEQRNGSAVARQGKRKEETVGSVEGEKGEEMAGSFVEKLGSGARIAGGGRGGEHREEEANKRKGGLHQVPHQCLNAVFSGLEDLQSPESP